jgi:hypothetical protein
MKFISILVTFFVIFNINSICYSSSLDNINNSNVLSIKYDFNLDNTALLEKISLNEDNKTNDLITSNQILSGSYGAYVIAYLISFFIFGIQAIQQRNNPLYMFGLILSTYTLPSFISAFFIYNDSKDEYQGDFSFTVLGAFTGTVLYYLLSFLAVFIESKVSNEIKSKISDFLFIPLIILLPLFTSTFATIFYNLSKKPKENVLTEVEIVEEQRKIQESLLSSLSNIQVNRGNIEYKVLSF